MEPMLITNELRVSREQLLELFPACDIEIFFRDPKSDQEFEERYLPNKLWRLNNLYTIINKQGDRIQFVMNYSQLRVYAASILHPRLIILKSRQQGISTFWLISYFDDTLFFPDINVGLMAQGRDEAGTLLDRTKFAWNTLDETIKGEAGVALTTDNKDELGFTNNATIFIRTSFRSATLQRLHISEYGKICNKTPERAKETKTGTLQAIAPGNTVVVESTAEGINDFKRMWDKDYGKVIAKLGPKEFLCIFLSWVDDPDCNFDTYRKPTKKQAEYFAKVEGELGIKLTQTQKNFWIDQYDELGEATFQEYPATPEEAFQAVREGAYYDRLFKKHVVKRGRIVDDLWDSNLPVEVFMDLGMNDDFVLTYVQVWNDEWRIINEHKNSGEGLAYYVKHMNDTPYQIDCVYGPHDLAVRELGTGVSRRDTLWKLGVTNLVILPKVAIAEGIEMTRNLIPHLWIDSSCTYIKECFENYSKEWDAKLEVWKDKPLHDEWSHGADNVRYLALTRSNGLLTVHKPKKNGGGRKPNNRQVVDGMAM